MRDRLRSCWLRWLSLWEPEPERDHYRDYLVFGPLSS